MAEDSKPESLLPERPPQDFFRFLIVDDEPVARNLMRSILQSAGYTEIDEVDSGEAALETLFERPYHVVLLDKNMPGKDGLEVLQGGRAAQPNCEFIMITAYGSMETAIQAMDLGAFSYVTKPFSEVKVIIRRVDAALERVIVRHQNEILVDRLRMVIVELERANAELKMVRLGNEPATGQEKEIIGRVGQAITHLRKIAVQIDQLGEHAKGKAAAVIGGIGKGVKAVANMLQGGDSPEGNDPQ
jgi:DNA-binding NtrC family response regulator